MKKITFAIVLIVALVIGSAAGFAATSTTNSDAAANTSFTGTETHSHPTTTETLAPATDDVAIECEYCGHQNMSVDSYNSWEHTYCCENCNEYTITDDHCLEEITVGTATHRVCECGYVESSNTSMLYDMDSTNVFAFDRNTHKLNTGSDNHTLTSVFTAYEHFMVCECGYVSEYHTHVNYESIDEHRHEAYCCQCEEKEVRKHSNEFECHWCDYTANGTFVGIILETYEEYISLLVEGRRYDFSYEFYANASYSKGDFVLITYTGWDITMLYVVVPYVVINNLAEWPFYTPAFVHGGNISDIEHCSSTSMRVWFENGESEYLHNCVIYGFEDSTWYTDCEAVWKNEFIFWFEFEGKTIVLDIYRIFNN